MIDAWRSRTRRLLAFPETLRRVVPAAGFPLFVIGLCALLHDRIPWWGIGIVRCNGLPTWTGYALAIGVVLVAAASGMGNHERTLAAAVPDIAFVGMGITLVRRGLGIGKQ